MRQVDTPSVLAAGAELAPVAEWADQHPSMLSSACSPLPRKPSEQMSLEWYCRCGSCSTPAPRHASQPLRTTHASHRGAHVQRPTSSALVAYRRMHTAPAASGPGQSPSPWDIGCSRSSEEPPPPSPAAQTAGHTRSVPPSALPLLQPSVALRWTAAHHLALHIVWLRGQSQAAGETTVSASCKPCLSGCVGFRLAVPAYRHSLRL